MKRSSRPALLPLGTNPWIYFILWVFLLGSLSYAALPVAVRAFFILDVLLLFGFWVLRDEPTPIGLSRSLEQGPLPSVPAWVWLGIIILGLFLRFWRLESLSLWPNLDEGRVSLFALEQSRHWDGKLLYGYNQLPPLFYWLYAVFFKIVSPSLFSLWLFPALLSALILQLGLVAARLFLPRSLGFLFVFFLALGFWPLYAGRFAAQGLLVLLWEMLVLVGLGLFFRASTRIGALLASGGLGVLVGIGFYVHLHWPIVALATVLAWEMILKSRKVKGSSWAGFIFSFFLPLLLIPIPLLMAILRTPSFGDYMGSLLSTTGGNLHRFSAFGASLSALFWGTSLDYFAYKPFWGGLLNPILGSLFLLGLAEWWKVRRQDPAWGILAAFVLFLLPALLTNNVETFRMIQLLPLILLTVALGLGVLLKNVGGPRRPLALVPLLFISLGLDLFHLTGVYPAWWASHPSQWSANYKSRPFYDACQALQPLEQKEGPGALLFPTRVAPDDQTLAVASFPFNTAWNPGLGGPHWVAFFQWDDEGTAMAQRFPNSSFISLGDWPENLSQGLQWIHGLGLRLVRVEDKDHGLWSRWIAAEQGLEQAAFQDLNRPGRENHRAILQGLQARRSSFERDPFLDSLYWETLAAYEKADGKEDQALEDLTQAVRSGFPRASILHRLAVLEVKAHFYNLAYQHFREAGRLNSLFKPPVKLLERLQKERSKGKTTKGVLK